MNHSSYKSKIVVYSLMVLFFLLLANMALSQESLTWNDCDGSNDCYCLTPNRDILIDSRVDFNSCSGGDRMVFQPSTEEQKANLSNNGCCCLDNNYPGSTYFYCDLVLEGTFQEGEEGKSCQEICTGETPQDDDTTPGEDDTTPEDPDGDSDLTSCIPNWVLVWERSDKQCGTLISITDTNECPNTKKPYDVGFNRPCWDLPIPTTVCGDGAIEGLEQCEFDSSGNFMFKPGEDTCEVYPRNMVGNYFNGGTLLCDSTCLVSTDQCFWCPTSSNGCTSSKMCDNCPICEEADICRNFCSVDDESGFTLTLNSVFDEQRGFELLWNLNDLCLNGIVSILRCYGENCGPSEIIRSDYPVNLKNYVDVDFDDTASGIVGYRLQFSYTQFGESITFSSKTVYKELPDPRCVGVTPNNKFCSNNEVINCDADGKLNVVEACLNDKVCVEKTSMNDARCVNVTICDTCSGPFGLFSHKNSAFGSICRAQDLVNVCFAEDYAISLSIIGKLNACSDIVDCYSYRTMSSCEYNPCNYLALQNKCEWKPFPGMAVNNELGLGVCAPKDFEDTKCSNCDNNPLTGSCTQDLCLTVYGNSTQAVNSRSNICFYNAEPTGGFASDVNYCMNSRDVSCETYNNREECIGSSSGPNTFSISINYFNDNGVTKSNSGTHNLTTPSGDVLGKGKCYWLESQNKCVKDSAFRSNYSVQELSALPDCDRDDLSCLTDFKNPTTDIYLNGTKLINNYEYSKNQLNAIAFLVSESLINNDYPMLGLYLGVCGSNNYPDSKLNVFRNTVLTMDVDTSKTYCLSFYSKDKSNNLEVVKKYNIKLRPGLNFNVEPFISPGYNELVGMVLSNVTFKIDNAPGITCSGSLYQGNPSVLVRPPETITSIGGVLQWKYTNLEDNDYSFNVKCFDEFQQYFTKEINLVLEEDKTLYEPTPKFATFNATNKPTQISIRTISKASCTYRELNSSTHIRYSTDSDGLVHNSSITVSNDDGIYIYKTNCTFDNKSIGNNGHFVGNKADTIFFAIDTMPPKFSILDMSTSPMVLYNDSIPRNSLDLQIVCNKTNPLTVYGGFDLSFDCNTNAYYKLLAFNLDDTFYSVVDESPFDFGVPARFNAIPRTYKKMYLNVTLSDVGGNSDEHEVYINLRDLGFEIPVVTICDPITLICN